MEIFTQFGLQPILLAAQIVNFLILLWLLKRFLYKPILKLLEERRSAIERSQKQTKEIEERLKELDAREAKVLDKAHKQSQTIIDEAKHYSQRLIEDRLKEAHAETEALIKRAQTHIAAQQEAMRKETEAHFLSLIARAVVKITGSLLTPKQRQTLTKEALREINSIKRSTPTS